MMMENAEMICPQCDGQLHDVRIEKTSTLRGVEVTFEAPSQQCTQCGLEMATVEQAGEMQKLLVDAYRRTVGLLTSAEIQELRKSLGLSQQAFSDRLDVGVASIKRWETGVIQSSSMDKLMRCMMSEQPCNAHTGHRDFSLPRVRLVLDRFEHELERQLVKEDDRMLYAAKYAWYADMVAFRDHGQSMTGATYAALPMGPQLNNYRDLVEEIQKANTDDAPELTVAETEIIAAIARAFPTDKSVFDASHREKVWLKRSAGELIPYTDAVEITEVTI